MDATGQGEIFKVVRIFDPAVKWSEVARDGFVDVDAYRETRDHALLTSYVDGKKPMVFHTRRLRRSMTRDVSSAPTPELQNQYAFMCGVEFVEMPDGNVLRPARERWTEDELDAFDFVDVDDIGKVVLQRSRLPFGSPAYFVAPHSSAVALAALLFRSAAPSRPAAPPSSSEPAAP